MQRAPTGLVSCELLVGGGDEGGLLGVGVGGGE